ncbi:hypothetical protein CISIN_1g0232421mg, partial [Citrus sinensis]
DC